MGFFDDLFNKSADKEELKTLGRFSDAYKPSINYKTWEASLIAFETEEYFKSLELLLDFLKNPNQDNISFEKSSEAIDFQFFQGSKVIVGKMTSLDFRAEVKIAQAAEINIGLSRRLLEKNYLLKYSRFALNELGHILLIFDSYTMDASPNKLYQGLKEMAIQADKLDDLILDEFKELEAINSQHIIPRTEELKQHQYEYLQSEIKNLFHEIESGKLNIDQFPGGLSFLLLAVNYKLDFLLTPQGFLMDNLEENHRVFFTNTNSEVSFRNNQFIKSFRKIQGRKEEEIKKELYDVISTFGLPAPSPHETLQNLILNEMSKMDWYKENNHTAVALAIPTYIVGYSLFSYALPMPDMKLLELFYKVTESEFLNDGYFLHKGEPNARRIKKEIDAIESKYKPIYPDLQINTSRLNFSNLVEFAETYLTMIRNINLNQQ